MRWQGRRKSTNVEDRRGMSTGKLALGGGGGLIAIAALVLGLVFGLDLGQVAETVGVSGNTPSTTSTSDEAGDFVAVILADTEDYWKATFKDLGRTGDDAYHTPSLVLYTGIVQTGSGTATSATGPFYSPADQTIYIDLSFYEDLQRRYGAGGDAAQAYVIAHEVGHAVQDQLGLLDDVAAQEEGVSETIKNQLSVRIELQADFYAGLVAHYQGDQEWLEPGDIEEALNAANAIGDDRLQKQAQGYVVPDSFTHGSSEQRMRWFMLGYETGDFSQGDTFSIPYNEL